MAKKLKTIKLADDRKTPGICGKRPNLNQQIYNPMAPPCAFKPGHAGGHSWQNDTWKIK